ARGLDVFALTPSEFLTENEIEAARLASQGEIFNPQQQFPVSWPAEPVVARAYIDQLAREEQMPEQDRSALEELLTAASASLAEEDRDRSLARKLERMAGSLRRARDSGTTQRRREALADTLQGIAKRLS
ncbi:MAG: DUF305 domain-containing protein, partial [Pseudomonadota bacterium]